MRNLICGLMVLAPTTALAVTQAQADAAKAAAIAASDASADDLDQLYALEAMCEDLLEQYAAIEGAEQSWIDQQYRIIRDVMVDTSGDHKQGNIDHGKGDGSFSDGNTHYAASQWASSQADYLQAEIWYIVAEGHYEHGCDILQVMYILIGNRIVALEGE